MNNSEKSKPGRKPGKRTVGYHKQSKYRTDEKGLEYYGNTLLCDKLKEVLQNTQYIYKVECDSPLFYIHVWTKGKIIEIMFTEVCLNDLLELLGCKSFVQISKSGAMNSSYFQDYYCNDKEGYTVLMDNDVVAYVSKFFRKNFRDHIGVRPGKPPVVI